MNNKIAHQALPKAKPYELRDAKLNGLLLRVQPSGVKTWYLEFERGKRIRLGRLSSMGHSEAVEAAKNALGPYWAGTDPRIERQKRKQVSTFGDFIDEHYADWAAAHQKTATATIKRLKVSFRKVSEHADGDDFAARHGALARPANEGRREDQYRQSRHHRHQGSPQPRGRVGAHRGQPDRQGEKGAGGQGSPGPVSR